MCEDERSYCNKSLLARFFGHCFLPLVLLVLFIVSFVIAMVVGTVGPYDSISLPDHQDTDFPDYIAQLTDIHNSHIYPDRTDYNTKVLNLIDTNLNPDIVVFSGDLIDATKSANPFVYHEQFPDNWDSFINTTSKSTIEKPYRKLIMVAGNHDAMDVESDTIEKNPFRKYYLQPDQDFTIQTYKTSKLNLISFHPIRFPMVSGPVGMFPFVDNDQLNKLENAFDDDRTNILISHYPATTLWSGFNSNGHDIAHLMKKPTADLTGHTHPSSAVIYRYGNAVHVVASPSRTHTVIAVTTIDNGMASIRDVDVSKDENILITYPIPKEQLTSYDDFSKTSFDVRALIFATNDVIATVYIDGKSMGTMIKLSNPRDRVYLYKLHVDNIADGDHVIEIKTNKTSVKQDLFIGKTCPKMKAGGDFTKIATGMFMLGVTLAVYIIALIRIIPLWLIPAVKVTLDGYQKVLSGADNDYSVLKMVYMGPLWFCQRLRNAPLIVYIVTVVLYLWIFIIPLYISPGGDKIGAVFVWGMIMDGKTRFYGLIFIIWMFYILFYLMPLTSLIGHRYEPHPTLWETIVFGVILLLALLIWCLFAAVSGEAISFFGSPVTYIFFAATGFITAKLIIDGKKAKVSEEEIIQDQKEDGGYEDKPAEGL